MKKIIGIIILGLMALGVTACSVNSESKTLTSEQSLASMAFLSSNLLNLNDETTSQGLSNNLSEDELEVEDEIETINEYLVLLESFMENGAQGFGEIKEVESDRLEYANMINIIVAGETYKLYYNFNAITSEITGIFIVENQEYTIIAYNYLDDADELEDDQDDADEFEDDQDDADEFEDDQDDENDKDEADDMSFTKLTNLTTEETTEIIKEDNETKMVLMASNGNDTIKITYKTEVESDETETKFEMETYINGVEKEVSIEIKTEQNEYKIEIEDGDNFYEFKREVESEGIKYELEYEVNGVKGEIKIIESSNELEEKTYTYEIEEEGKHKEFEIDDNEDDDNDDNETQDTSFIL
ncbi:MAG: hypothetical protein WC152_03125 [Candidatus Izemoplasmatales bacterium]